MCSAWFPPDMMVSIQAKEFSICFISPKNLVSESLAFAFWETAGELSCVSYWGVTSVWTLYYTGWLVDCCQNGCVSGRFSSLHKVKIELKVTTGFLVTCLIKPPMPQLFRLYPSLDLHFSTCPISRKLNVTQVDSIQVVETSDRGPVEQNVQELNFECHVKGCNPCYIYIFYF